MYVTTIQSLTQKIPHNCLSYTGFLLLLYVCPSELFHLLEVNIGDFLVVAAALIAGIVVLAAVEILTSVEVLTARIALGVLVHLFAGYVPCIVQLLGCSIDG